MGFLHKQIAILEGIPTAIERSIQKSIQDYDNVLLEYIKTDQLRKKGEDGKGNKLGQYREGYARIRINRGLQVAHIDLRFSGKLFASLKITANAKDFRVGIDVPYEKEVLERFGKDILQIQQENLVEFANNILLRNLKRDLNDEFSRARS